MTMNSRNDGLYTIYNGIFAMQSYKIFLMKNKTTQYSNQHSKKNN
ncbi:hypothetical protein J577_1133 [Acinetobacter sp. 263903-1]|nr:hypothetical protein J577_1133 [Acinetobacter sp. 263903-1]